MVHWRREWQPTSVFLPQEPHEQYKKAKRALESPQIMHFRESWCSRQNKDFQKMSMFISLYSLNVLFYIAGMFKLRWLVE